MTSHPSSRALLLTLLEKLRQTEGISRTWQTLQPLAAELEGMATAMLDALEKNGLREGACCKIRGFVRRGTSWLSEDKTGLDIDRVSLSSLRKHSWLDDVAYRMRPFYRLYQDEMNMFNTPGGV